MPDATLRDYEELVGLVVSGKHPILPQPHWGHGAAMIAHWWDETQKLIPKSEADIEAVVAEVGYRVQARWNPPHDALIARATVHALLSGDWRQFAHVPSDRSLSVEQAHGITYCRRCGLLVAKDSDPTWTQSKPCRPVPVTLRGSEMGDDDHSSFGDSEVRN